MTYKQIKWSDLVVNSSNDRHGDLQTEEQAIAWLFKTKEHHMKNLAKDIVEKYRVFEPPLVKPFKGKYLIFDGNRRITCLKLIIDPSKAPTAILRKFFTGFQTSHLFDTSYFVECRVETNQGVIDDILHRRHTGTQNGVGQSTWDDRMKLNFIERTGRGQSKTIADVLEKYLRSNDLLKKDIKIPRSTMNRLLSSEKIRNQVGISFKNNQIRIIGEVKDTQKILLRIVEDLAQKKIVLGDIWDNARKKVYLDKVLVSQNDDYCEVKSGTGENIKEVKPFENANDGSLKQIRAPNRQQHLIPKVDFNITWSNASQRHKSIWEELQFKLKLEEHPNAISVLFRVLIELSVNHYCEIFEVHSLMEKDKLKTKIRKVGEDMKVRGLINDDKLKNLKKLEQAENLISINTLNRYIHSYELSPSPVHLTAMWNNLSFFITICLNAKDV